MCISAAMVGAIASSVAAAGTIYAADQSRKQSNRALDAQRAETLRAETEPTKIANGRLALRRRAMAAQSLLTDGGAGRATLGG